MKQLKYGLTVLICFLCLAGQSQQQRVLRLEAGLKGAIPSGNFKNSIDQSSLRGWEAAVMYGVTDALAVGGQIGFQDFYQKFDRAVYHGPGSDVSAVISNSVQITPLLLKGKYFFGADGGIRPFAALGLGGSLVQYSTYYGQFPDSEAGFAFAAQPEAGVYIPVGQAKRVGINVAAAYNYIPFKRADLGINGLSHASLKAGVSIPLRR